MCVSEEQGLEKGWKELESSIKDGKTGRKVWMGNLFTWDKKLGKNSLLISNRAKSHIFVFKRMQESKKSEL